MTPSNEKADGGGAVEAKAIAAVTLVRQLNQAAWAAGNADAEDSWKRQERTAAEQDRLLLATLSAVDQLYTDAESALKLQADRIAELEGALKATHDYLKPRVQGTGGAGDALLPKLRAALSKTA